VSWARPLGGDTADRFDLCLGAGLPVRNDRHGLIRIVRDVHLKRVPRIGNCRRRVQLKISGDHRWLSRDDAHVDLCRLAGRAATNCPKSEQDSDEDTVLVVSHHDDLPLP